MKFNLKDLNPGTWFYFDDSKPDDGKISIRVLNSKRLAEIRTGTVKTEVEYRSGNRHEFQVIDHAKRDEMIWDYCIVDWEKLTDDEDNPIECNTANKIELMNNHIGFSTFVESCLTRLNNDAVTYAEYSEKNL